MPALRAWWAWVGACGHVGGSRAMRCVARGFWRVDVSESPADPSRVAEFLLDYPPDARLGPGNASEPDCRR